MNSPHSLKRTKPETRALGIAVCDRETFDQGHIAIGAAVYVGQILGLAFGAEHGRPRL